jgi:hypothetical protein
MLVATWIAESASGQSTTQQAASCSQAAVTGPRDTMTSPPSQQRTVMAVDADSNRSAANAPSARSRADIVARPVARRARSPALTLAFSS